MPIGLPRHNCRSLCHHHCARAGTAFLVATHDHHHRRPRQWGKPRAGPLLTCAYGLDDVHFFLYCHRFLNAGSFAIWAIVLFAGQAHYRFLVVIGICAALSDNLPCLVFGAKTGAQAVGAIAQVHRGLLGTSNGVSKFRQLFQPVSSRLQCPSAHSA